VDEDTNQVVIMECSVSYSLSDELGQELESGEAQARIGEEALSILPRFGEAVLVPLRDILEISECDYKIRVALTSKDTLVLSDLGYRYEDFLRVLSKLRNEILLKDLLIHETLRKSGVEAEFACFDETGSEKQAGQCEARLYETAIVLIPEKGEFLRIPYSDISGVREGDYEVILETEFGERIVLSKMGRKFDPFLKVFSEVMNELSLKVQSSLKELLPSANPSVIRRASRLMREGKAARKGDLDLLSPELWAGLEKKLEIVGVKEGYDFLKSLAQEEKICIGLKRGLLGDLTGEYIWFLIPIYSTDPDAPGNAVAMEASSTEGSGGKATYFFRIVNRKDYPDFRNKEDLDREVDGFIKKINRCMLAINFRREPVYLPDERLEEPRYQKYKFAIAKIPALQELRRLFIGRVIHSSPEQWKKDVMDLLRFNVSAQDDNAKWKKGGQANGELAGYITKLDFDPEGLEDITKLPEKDRIFGDDPTEGKIPPHSKVRLSFRTFCLEEGKPAPDASIPHIFLYEVLDIPMYLKIMRYFVEHPEIDQSLGQGLIWKLAKKPKFDEISEEEQDLLLSIDPYADAEIDNYESINYKHPEGYPPELWPKEIIPQPIPGTELFGKIVKMKGFSEMEVEFYNPAAAVQKLPLVKFNPGSLTALFFDRLRQMVGFGGVLPGAGWVPGAGDLGFGDE